MNKLKVYIFTCPARGAAYGVGTYIKELRSLLDAAHTEYGLVRMYEEKPAITSNMEDGCETIHIPRVNLMSEKDHQRYSRNVGYILRDIIKIEKDTKLIFHLNFMTDPDLVSALKKSFPKCRVVLVCHYTNWSFSLMGDEKKFLSIMKKSSRKRNPMEKQIVSDFRKDLRMIQKVDRFVCVAEHSLRTFKAAGHIDETKCVVINNALKDEYDGEASKADIKEKYRIRPDEKVILFVGRLDPVKGIFILLKSFEQVLDKHPEAHLFVVGEGSFNPCLNCASHSWARISFTGLLSKEKVYDFYRIADVGVVPSVHEEFGLVAIEMMMHQIPIVVSDVGGLAEIIDDNENGLKVPVTEADGKREIRAEAFSEKICSLLDDPAHAQALAQNAREKFLDRYERQLFGQRMQDLYENV